MNPKVILSVAKLRTCVAFLGEKDQHNWWISSFLSPSGEAFLSPVFPKTSFLSRITGASMAASRIHDEYIGVGDVFHLFRLPEHIEQHLGQSLSSENAFSQFISTTEEAISQLSDIASNTESEAIGPTLLQQNDIDQSTVNDMASMYLAGFKSAEPVYPYYRSNV